MSTPEFDRQRAHTLRLLASILHNAQEAHRILTMVKDVRPQPIEQMYWWTDIDRAEVYVTSALAAIVKGAIL